MNVVKEYAPQPLKGVTIELTPDEAYDLSKALRGFATPILRDLGIVLSSVGIG